MARIRLPFFAFILLLFISACATKESAPTKETAESSPAAAPTVGHGTVSATIDGTAWQSAPASSKDDDAAIASIDPKTGFITIRGTNASAASEPQVIEITLKSSQPGNYTLAPDFDHVQTATYSIGSDTSQLYFIHEKQSGQAVISQSDGHRVTGTFSFDARNTQGKDIRISNGTFDVLIKQ